MKPRRSFRVDYYTTPFHSGPVFETLAPAAWKAAVFLVLAALALPAFGAETVVGSVKTVQGTAAVQRGPNTVPIHAGMHLLLNDILRTAADGSLGAILQDGTRISLGPNTELKVDRFVYQPVAGKFGLLLRLSRGMMAYVSGRIAEFSPESVGVETPVAVLGLRGTHFAVSLDGTQEVSSR